MILHEPGLDPRPFLIYVVFEYPVHVLREIEDDGLTNGLSRQARTSTAREDGGAVVRGNVQRALNVLVRSGDHNSDWQDPIHARISAIKDLGIGVETNLSLKNLLEFLCEMFPFRHGY